MNVLRNFLMTGTAFLLLFQSSCSTQSKIARYSGDGEIKAMPDYGLTQGGGGCTVKFKPIKLDSSAHFTYRFKGLPNWHFNLFFAIEDKQAWADKKQNLNGTLAMTLKDTNGNVILQFQRKLSELVWSRAGLGPWELYDFQNVHFTPNSSAEYMLEIKIEPDSLLKDDEGYVLLRGGGHEGISIGF
jgi:hypothetical protein